MKLLDTKKGTNGYINRQKIKETIRTIIYFVFALGLYLIGYMTLKTNKNLFTILAVLSVLPAAKCAVSMIMFYRFSSISQSEYEEIKNAGGDIPLIFELVFTSSEKSYYIKSAACCDNTIVALLDNNKKTDLSNEVKKHILAAIEREGLSGYSVKIFNDNKDYNKRLVEMNEKLDGLSDTSSAIIFALFKAITL